jgi:soluble lytic murein transglycosylase-like protein
VLTLTRRRRLALGVAVAAILIVMSLVRIEERQPRTVQGSIDYWARRYDVDIHLARAVAWMESGNNPAAVSPTGARGVMQVEPWTWRYTEQLLGTHVDNTTDGNIRIGVAYLHQMLREFGGDTRLALAAYYQGPNSVREVGLYGSSERYVSTVLALARTR